MTGYDPAFRYRLHYAAGILEEVAEHYGTTNIKEHDQYAIKALQLEHLAAEYEANHRRLDDELEELTFLAQQIGGLGAWTNQKAKQLAQNILEAGYHRIEDQ